MISELVPTLISFASLVVASVAAYISWQNSKVQGGACHFLERKI